MWILVTIFRVLIGVDGCKPRVFVFLVTDLHLLSLAGMLSVLIDCKSIGRFPVLSDYSLYIVNS